MILSVSRRTDIPSFYGEWFYNRIKEGFVMVRNPMNYHSISRINISPNVVDCIVFWTKNPTPFIPFLNEIDEKYKFYFQYTLNAYDVDIEKNIPKIDERIDSLLLLSKKYGSDRVIWRYDPILISNKYDLNWHIEKFTDLCQQFNGAVVSTCVFSFLDVYAKNSSKLNKNGVRPLTEPEMQIIAEKFADIAKKNNIKLKTCSENMGLIHLGIEKSCCVDSCLISKLIGCNIDVTKDKNQRAECGCVESIDIGQYNTCSNGCLYCYANYSDATVVTSKKKHNPKSPLLIGEVEEDDKITERNVRSLRKEQISVFDLL
jgi:DNA repair photolyase